MCTCVLQKVLERRLSENTMEVLVNDLPTSLISEVQDATELGTSAPKTPAGLKPSPCLEPSLYVDL